MASPTIDAGLSPPSTAASRVFYLPELLENILSHLIDHSSRLEEKQPYGKAAPCLQLFVMQRVNHTFRLTIQSSPILRQHMWLVRMPGISQASITGNATYPSTMRSGPLRALLDFKKIAYSPMYWFFFQMCTGLSIIMGTDADELDEFCIPGAHVVTHPAADHVDTGLSRKLGPKGFFHDEASWRRIKLFCANDERRMSVAMELRIQPTQNAASLPYSITWNFIPEATLGCLWDRCVAAMQMSHQEHLEQYEAYERRHGRAGQGTRGRVPGE